VISIAKRLNYSIDELNYIHFLDFIRLQRIHFGENGEKDKKPEPQGTPRSFKKHFGR
jgi:hypothetical protein